MLPFSFKIELQLNMVISIYNKFKNAYHNSFKTKYKFLDDRSKADYYCFKAQRAFSKLKICYIILS